MKAAIIGISGPKLLPEEKELLQRQQPTGVILFGRNIVDRAQFFALTDHIKASLPPESVIMIDQEGGRVARLKPPLWQGHPAASVSGRLYDVDPADGARLAWLNGALIGADCAEAGIDVVCAPVLDRRMPHAHDIVGDRSFSGDPAIIATLARAFADGLMAAGVQPLGKHAPGHGRAMCDSHLDMPVVVDQSEEDLAPFKAMADLPWMMTAHILFPQWDRENPATLSPTIVQRVIRHQIGFEHLLVTDDLEMKALRGSQTELAERALNAGCDIVLPCGGQFSQNVELLDSCPDMTAAAAQKLANARRQAALSRQPLNVAVLADERRALLAKTPPAE